MANMCRDTYWRCEAACKALFQVVLFLACGERCQRSTHKGSVLFQTMSAKKGLVSHVGTHSTERIRSNIRVPANFCRHTALIRYEGCVEEDGGEGEGVFVLVGGWVED